MAEAKTTEASALKKESAPAPKKAPAPEPKKAPAPASSSSEWKEKGFPHERAYKTYLKKFKS